MYWLPVGACGHGGSDEGAGQIDARPAGQIDARPACAGQIDARPACAALAAREPQPVALGFTAAHGRAAPPTAFVALGCTLAANAGWRAGASLTLSDTVRNPAMAIESAGCARRAVRRAALFSCKCGGGGAGRGGGRARCGRRCGGCGASGGGGTRSVRRVRLSRR